VSETPLPLIEEAFPLDFVGLHDKEKLQHIARFGFQLTFSISIDYIYFFFILLISDGIPRKYTDILKFIFG